jgi:hypothetical protein
MIRARCSISAGVSGVWRIVCHRAASSAEMLSSSSWLQRKEPVAFSFLKSFKKDSCSIAVLTSCSRSVNMFFSLFSLFRLLTLRLQIERVQYKVKEKNEEKLSMPADQVRRVTKRACAARAGAGRGCGCAGEQRVRESSVAKVRACVRR